MLMNPLERFQFQLHAFQQTSTIQVHGWVKRKQQALSLEYTISGNLDSIRWPVSAKPGKNTNLWQHTCFECFISAENCSEYWEYNFSPAQQWDIQCFSSYREAKELTPEKPLPPQLVLDQRPDLARLHVVIPLSADMSKQKLELGITAVIETQDQQLNYFALTHKAQRPDFHRRDSFTLKL